MKRKSKKLELNLDFLGEGISETIEREHEKKDEHISVTDNTSPNSGKWAIGVISFSILIIIIIVASNSDDNTRLTTTFPLPVNTEVLDYPPDTSEVVIEPEINSHFPVVEPKETPAVVQTPIEDCQERYGYNATYDSSTNSCGCAIGYSMGATSQQCVSYTDARDESCAAEWPGTSFLKYDSETGKNICDCEFGYYWNNERTACYSLSSFNQSCVDSYGSGAYSTTENDKRVCDCGYGYDWNVKRDACITTASIDDGCERDIGRNSRYAGYVEDGKYICTEPY